MNRLKLTVIVPSYRRCDDLRRCLAALNKQRRAPQQVIVVARAHDRPTWEAAAAAAGALPLELVLVGTPGMVAALNVGLERAAGDILAFTDDDAAPHADWLERIETHFSIDPGLGGLGGRDWVFQHGRLEDGEQAIVGKLNWFGRCVGNHHLGIGPPRDVDVLKGANMSFRSAALVGLRFDERLRGSGAQVGNDLGVSLAVKRRGWKLLYDPLVAVDHYPAVRYDEDQRSSFSVEAIRNAAFNETLVLCEHFTGLRRWAFMVWALFVGNRAVPGVVQWLRLLRQDAARATARFAATWSGRMRGFLAAR